MFHHRLSANQEVIYNHVLHNRTGFVEGETLAEQRLLYRIRFATGLLLHTKDY